MAKLKVALIIAVFLSGIACGESGDFSVKFTSLTYKNVSILDDINEVYMISTEREYDNVSQVFSSFCSVTDIGTLEMKSNDKEGVGRELFFDKLKEKGIKNGANLIKIIDMNENLDSGNIYSAVARLIRVEYKNVVVSGEVIRSYLNKSQDELKIAKMNSNYIIIYDILINNRIFVKFKNAELEVRKKKIIYTAPMKHPAWVLNKVMKMRWAIIILYCRKY